MIPGSLEGIEYDKDMYNVHSRACLCVEYIFASLLFRYNTHVWQGEHARCRPCCPVNK
jgi:hypothetical protein